MLAAETLEKRFGGHHVLRGVSARFGPGEVVAVVGENGAGKSTLLKVLAGVVPHDGGAATLDGAGFAPRSQREAEARGVTLVFQELNVNRSLSIAENVMLGRLRDFRRLGLIDWRRLARAAQAILDRMGAAFSVTDDIAGLDLGQIKTIEVARALALDPRYVFFDESTAFLGHAEAGRLMRVIRELKRQGIGVAFVSHHLHEVFEIADRLVVLKDGALVGSYATAEMSEDRLHQLMVGRELAGGLFPSRGAGAQGAVAASLDGVRMQSGAGTMRLELRRGQILGIGGLKGSGGEALIAALSGTEQLAEGSMRRDGGPYAPRAPRDAWEAGIASLPGDRTGEGVLPDFSVADNLTLAVRPRRFGFFHDAPAARRLAEAQVRALGIKARDLDAAVASLSGGNMQKVVLGKCLAARPEVLLLNNPTRGVDVGAKAEIYRVIRRLTDGGTAVLMVTEDLPELLGLSDLIVVTKGGRVVREFGRGERPSEAEVVRWMM